jgi:hypothetical protein
MYLKVYKEIRINRNMKLQKQLSRKVGNKEYPKYVAVIPPKIVKEAKLKEGDELNIEVKKDKIIISKI